mmetsp:Transcript_45085/g.107148  ORF Transcript_45085/g.107148 Transcript_45085/m.107148 type:complete len:224 (-) Transcript_45085:497-1168(-)
MQAVRMCMHTTRAKELPITCLMRFLELPCTSLQIVKMFWWQVHEKTKTGSCFAMAKMSSDLTASNGVPSSLHGRDHDRTCSSSPARIARNPLSMKPLKASKVESMKDACPRAAVVVPSLQTSRMPEKNRTTKETVHNTMITVSRDVYFSAESLGKQDSGPEMQKAIVMARCRLHCQWKILSRPRYLAAGGSKSPIRTKKTHDTPKHLIATAASTSQRSFGEST